MGKKEKKERKKNKKIVSNVKKAFGYTKENKKEPYPIISKNIIRAIADSVHLNKALVKRDKRAIEKWQQTYYQELFNEFKNLVRKHNDVFQFKADDLMNKIESRKLELKRLKAEIKKLQAEKVLLENND